MRIEDRPPPSWAVLELLGPSCGLVEALVRRLEAILGAHWAVLSRRKPKTLHCEQLFERTRKSLMVASSGLARRFVGACLGRLEIFLCNIEAMFAVLGTSWTHLEPFWWPCWLA